MDSKYNLGLLMKFDIFKRFFSLFRKKKKLPLTKEEVDAIHQQIFIHNQSFPAMPLSDLTLWVKPFRRPKYMYLKKLLRFSDSLEQANVIASWGLGRKTLDLFDIAKKLKNLCFYSKMDSSVAYIPGQPMQIQSSEPASVSVLIKRGCITME